MKKQQIEKIVLKEVQCPHCLGLLHITRRITVEAIEKMEEGKE